MIPRQTGFYVGFSKYPEIQLHVGGLLLFEFSEHNSQLLNPLLHKFV